jgi:hypothetical protein
VLDRLELSDKTTRTLQDWMLLVLFTPTWFLWKSLLRHLSAGRWGATFPEWIPYEVKNPVTRYRTRLLKSQNRVRVAVLEDDQLSLSILIQNVGRSFAEDYRLLVTFDRPQIRIVDMYTETLEINQLYLNSPDLFINSQCMKYPRVHEDIRNSYDTYMLIPFFSDFLVLNGTLESGAYEQFLLKLTFRPANQPGADDTDPDSLEDFLIVCRINCKEAFQTKMTFVQPVKICRR